MNVHTPESDMETTVRSPTPGPISIFSTVVSPPPPTPIPIYSNVTSTCHVPRVLVPICNAISEILCYAFGQGPNLSLSGPPAALRQSTMSGQATLSSPMTSPTPPFNIHLDPSDMNFLKKKLSNSQERQKNVLLEASQPNPFVTRIAVLEQALHEG